MYLGKAMALVEPLCRSRTLLGSVHMVKLQIGNGVIKVCVRVAQGIELYRMIGKAEHVIPSSGANPDCGQHQVWRHKPGVGGKSRRICFTSSFGVICLFEKLTQPQPRLCVLGINL